MTPDMELLRDVVANSGKQAMNQDPSEEIMRLSLDPLLLHAHLQADERLGLASSPGKPEARIECHLPNLAVRPFDHRRKTVISPMMASYAMKEKLSEPSLHPEAFAASPDDKVSAIHYGARDEAEAMPPNLIGGILVSFAVILLAASIADFVIYGLTK